jgi:hypothetical protein
MELDVDVGAAVVSDRARRADSAQQLAAAHPLAARERAIEQHVTQHHAELSVGPYNLQTAGLVARRERPGD